MLKQAFLVAVCSVFFLPSASVSAHLVDGVWFNCIDDCVESKAVTASVALYNEQEASLSGTITFTFADGVSAEEPFEIAPRTLAAITTTRNFGPGTFIVTPSLVIDGTVSGTLKSAALIVDTDTDSDGIGNTRDSDDDNDGLTDEEERTHGTNPLVRDSDADGVSDGAEITATTNPLDENDVPSPYATTQLLGTASNALAVSTDMLTDIGSTIINTVAPHAENLATTLEEKRDAQLKNYDGFADSRTEADVATLPSALDIQSTFSAVAALANVDWLTLWQKISTIGLTIGAFLMRNWIWVLVCILALVLLRTLYRWQRHEY